MWFLGNSIILFWSNVWDICRFYIGIYSWYLYIERNTYTNLEFIFIQETLSYQEDKSMDDIPPMAILEKTAKTADDGKY